jgi:hypothetical protein
MRSVHFLRAAHVSAATCLAVVLVGCSSSSSDRPTGEVSGKVTFKGKAVTEGTVTFLNPTEGGSAEAKIELDGGYSIPTLAVGEYVVVVTPLMELKDTDPGKSPPAPVEKPAPNIPMKYRQQGSTPLKTTVKGGKNEFNIEMK